MLSALNDSLLRELLKQMSLLHKTAVTADMSLVPRDSCVMSQMLSSFSCEMSYLLSRHTDCADVAADKLCCKLLVWLPHVADICSSLLHSDTVS